MECKKRVLLTSPAALNNGGVQHVIMTIVRNLSKLYNFDILVFNDYQNFYKNEFLSYGGRIYLFNRNQHKSLLKKLIARFVYNKNLYSFCLNLFSYNKYDIIHCNNQFSSGVILKAAKKYKVPIRICHSHGTYKSEGLIRDIFKEFDRISIRKCSNCLIACSMLSGQSFFGNNSKFRIIYNSYDEKKISFSNKSPSNLTLVQIGMFGDNKNQSFSLDVLYNLRFKIPNVILRLVGTGDSSFLLNKVHQLNLQKNVIFHNHDIDKSFLFENSTYLIMPSKSEGFPITLLEAQASGMYCFASNSIVDSVNCGGVIFCKLSAGPDTWSDLIYNFYINQKGMKTPFDCSPFHTSFFIRNIDILYNIKKMGER